MNFYKRFMGDYQRDTGHLSLAEHGAYALMLDALYATGRPLPADPKVLCRLLRADGPADRAAVAEVVRQFWRETPDGLVNDRALVEIEKAAKQASTNHDIAVAREASRKAAREAARQEHDSCSDRETNEDTNGALRARDHSHSHKNQGQTQRASGDAQRFPDFWNAYPNLGRRRNRKGCEAKWKARKLDRIADEILANLEALKLTDEWKRGFEPLPETYLNQDRWTDEVVDRAKVVDAVTGEVRQWHESAPGVIAKGAELDVVQEAGEHFYQFQNRVRAAAGLPPRTPGAH